MNAESPSFRNSKWRGKLDDYDTPLCASRPFLQTHSELWPDGKRYGCWDPAAGRGALVKELSNWFPKVLSSDIQSGVDFLQTVQARAPIIITNPPFRLATDFIEHALKLNPYSFAFLLRTKMLEGAKRYETIFRKHPPWLVYQFVERIKFFSSEVPREEQPGWNQEAFAWFVWVRGYKGDPRVRWLRKGPQP